MDNDTNDLTPMECQHSFTPADTWPRWSTHHSRYRTSKEHDWDGGSERANQRKLVNRETCVWGLSLPPSATYIHTPSDIRRESSSGSYSIPFPITITGSASPGPPLHRQLSALQYDTTRLTDVLDDIVSAQRLGAEGVVVSFGHRERHEGEDCS